MLHLGSMTTGSLAAWATERGATADSARAFARVLAGRFADRTAGVRVSSRLLALALEAFDDTPLRVDASPDPDGTVRFVVHLKDGKIVEAVAIPHPARTTVCLSTQAGCARGCVFCETGRLGLDRNLKTEEITTQFQAVARWLSNEGRPSPTNIVFMGMGEPLDNLDAVMQAVDVLTDHCGYAVARRRVTVSTVGVVPKMREFYRRSAGCRLAVSLHAANDREREALLPVARQWNLATLKEAIAQSPDRVFVQWTLIEGVNDSERHANELLLFCEGLDVRVNLIPLNPGPDETLRAPPMSHVRAFQKRLADAGQRTLVRLPHGQEVGGACGQLAGSLRGDPERRNRLPIVGRARR